MKNLITLAALMSLTACVSQAALWNSSWSGASYASTETSITSVGDVNDITKLESIFGNGSSGEGYYFRMTLADSGSKDNAYMLNFNTDNNTSGGNAGNSTYLGTGLTGIDSIVDAHYDGGVYSGSHYHTYSAGTNPNANFTSASIDSVNVDFDGSAGTQLEWFVPTTLLTEDTWVTGSIVDIGTEFAGEGSTSTLDLTSGFAVVPEPTSMALLALGMIAFGLRRKSRA